ncbi:hypothetical protein FGADI_7912 [Fusarium gaditjirri]|uniref:Uncharacterized protein n=1 Tax=Fusarium gaditjirri TaxID=282569 RepID=A0A8H4WUZ4_9HYPO|nr:hypothetical protein FGADI_7912 [Fusarium gaditjirri]
MAGIQPVEFPSLGDNRLPSGEQDKQILRRLKNACGQHSAQWDDETKREFVEYILKGYTRVTKTNEAQPSGHRLWTPPNITFAVWLLFRVTYEDDKLTKPKEWLRAKYKNIDPNSWVSPKYKKPKKSKGKRTSSSSNRATKPPPPQSSEPMNIFDDDDDDGMSLDLPDTTRSGFRAVNVLEASSYPARKRSHSATTETPEKMVRHYIPNTISSAGPIRSPSGHRFSSRISAASPSFKPVGHSSALPEDTATFPYVKADDMMNDTSDPVGSQGVRPRPNVPNP